MNLLEAFAIFGAGLAAGTINAIVGSGSLITFPVLLAFGFPPVVANVSNTVGLVPGSVSGAYGYRRELVGQKARLLRFGVVACLGGLTGAVLLLVLPASAFKAVVPVLIVAACILVVIQPAIARRMARRRTRARRPDGGPLLLVSLYLTAVYGGYFGAAQGVLMIGIMGLALSDELQRINAVKNVLAGLINGVAAALFIVLAHVAWRPALLLGVGSILGGQIGSRAGRRLPDAALRGVVVLVGIVAVVRLVRG